MDGIAIRRIGYGSTEYQDELALRDRILRKPLKLNLFDEDLGGEADDIHLGAFDGDMLVGVLVLTRLNAQTVRMRQVAVDEARQRLGIGMALVAAAERAARGMGYAQIVLHARMAAAGFYEKMGYERDGGPFDEVGIAHVAMRKEPAL
jgi:predicted GNAT family N-acyltransferase